LTLVVGETDVEVAVDGGAEAGLVELPHAHATTASAIVRRIPRISA
jgi:hypothetical protein